MTDRDDILRIVDAGKRLELKPRGDRWCHLSLCVIDDVFSIGAKYASTWRASRRYAAFAGLDPVTASAAEVSARRYEGSEETLSRFLERVGTLKPEELAEVLANRQLTSTRGGILKAEAVQRFARILNENGIDRIGDVSILLADAERVRLVEASLAKVPGHGSGLRVAYLWMLTGDDEHVKADRMVLRWTSNVLGRKVRVREASDLIRGAAVELKATPWEFDHAIWTHQRELGR